MRRSLRRPFAIVSTTVAFALLLTVSAEAQRKKAAPAKKKPAATAPAPTQAKPKTDTTTKPADESPATEEKKPTKKAAEEETEKPKETEKEKEPEKPAESSGGAKPTLVDLGVGIRGFQRHLGYKDDWNGTLPSYDLSGAPEADLTLGVFPIKNANGSITAGLVGSFGYAFALGSTY
jgi:hypothetical protein